ncbi:hypothetical protein D1B17_03990 [Companilactobacillus zhachilii]|uniref:Uncharacterized protein n=1 Tax=Companilactobacillus zhachilii TaxID=2304606 RepID=A0A386PTY9_9LACO|nr:hypothetical protein [Companilactobacillus zhachilii]AYE37837.1 hypothetical protein D1B17_03990 [Companilactobacillus zhachilii]
MSEISPKMIVYDTDLVLKIRKSSEVKINELNFIVKENGKNHYWNRKVTFEISDSPEINLNSDGVLRFLDIAGNRVGISLNLFEKINEISLDKWRN